MIKQRFLDTQRAESLFSCLCTKPASAGSSSLNAAGVPRALPSPASAVLPQRLEQATAQGTDSSEATLQPGSQASATERVHWRWGWGGKLQGFSSIVTFFAPEWLEDSWDGFWKEKTPVCEVSLALFWCKADTRSDCTSSPDDTWVSPLTVSILPSGPVTFLSAGA